MERVEKNEERQVIKNITLSDGRKAEILKGKGKDLFWVFQMANDFSEIVKLLMVRLIRIEGKPVTEDELEELDLQDTLILVRHFTELLTPLSQQRQSLR
jgi:hypothetical protein